MSEFTTKIQLQSQDVYIRELKVKHLKILLKTLVGDTPDLENVFNNLVTVLTQITTLNNQELKKLSVIDFLTLVLHIRCLSIGSSIQLEIKDKKNTNFNLNLLKVIDTLNETSQFSFKQTFDNFAVEYQILNIESFLFKEIDNIASIKFFIKKIFI